MKCVCKWKSNKINWLIWVINFLSITITIFFYTDITISEISYWEFLSSSLKMRSGGRTAEKIESKWKKVPLNSLNNEAKTWWRSIKFSSPNYFLFQQKKKRKISIRFYPEHMFTKRSSNRHYFHSISAFHFLPIRKEERKKKKQIWLKL